MTARRKLIEVSLPLEVINRESAREKSIRHGHPSTMHLWWARRPLAACRAVVFASLVDDPSSHPDEFPTEEDQQEERLRLFGILEALMPWESSDDEKVLAAAKAEILRSVGTSLPLIIDPFCGGGSIPLEAQRLGLPTLASDLNPVAVLVTKALIEIPARLSGRGPLNPSRPQKLRSDRVRGSQGLAEDVRYYGKWIEDEARKRLGDLYPDADLPTEYGGGAAPVIAWIWARTTTCPNPACRNTIPLTKTSRLGRVAGKDRFVHVNSVGGGHFEYTISDARSEPTVRGSAVVCPHCNQTFPFAAIREIVDRDGFGESLVALAARANRSLMFLEPNAMQEETAFKARPPWVPDLDLIEASQYMGPVNWGLKTVASLATKRQQTALAVFSDLLIEAKDKLVSDGADEDYAEGLVVCLSCAVGRCIGTWTSLSGWAGSFIRTFGFPALPFTWDFAEANPFSGATGSWSGAIDWVARVLDELPASGNPTVLQLDAASATTSQAGSVCITDPPYYNNVPYADLSDVFYGWHRRGIGRIYPQLFSTLATPKQQELVATPYHFNGDAQAAKDHFEEGMRQFFVRLAEQQHPDFPTTLFYAYKQEEGISGDSSVASTGWEVMLSGLLEAGLEVRATWPVRSERSGRLRETGSNALASSIVMVCRPRSSEAPLATRREFVAALRRELPGAFKTLQQGNVAPVDLAQAAIGPGMAIFSRYARVVEADGSKLGVRSALGLINQVLDESLTEQENEFDSSTRWAIAWFDQFGVSEGPYGVAETLSTAKNTAVSALVEEGVVVSRGGKVRLLRRDELADGWDPRTDSRLTVWEVAQHLVRALDEGGEARAGDIAAKAGSLGEVARDLAYRLYQTCDRKGWTQEALAYNALVVSWPEVQRLSAAPEPDSNDQGNLFI